jgi:ATP-dependent Clp protease ATP-binding subunit ClpC
LSSAEFFTGWVAGLLSAVVMIFWIRGAVSRKRVYKDPTLGRLHQLHEQVLKLPYPSTPGDLMAAGSFIELVKALADPRIPTSTLVGYLGRPEAILASAGLAALAGRPADPTVEKQLYSRINRYHFWVSHYLLKTLEAWHLTDEDLVRQVLGRIDNSWDDPNKGAVLDGFLRRRAAAGPSSIQDIDEIPGHDADVLAGILRMWIDPEIARPLLADLAGPDEEDDDDELVLAPPPPPAAPPRPPPPPRPEPKAAGVDGVGRMIRPREAGSDGILGCPSLDAQVQRVLASLQGSPARPVLVVGDPGVGKSSLMRRVAAALSREGWTLFEAGAADLNAGTKYVGTLEGRLEKVVKFLSEPRHLWVCPEFDQLLWAGRHEQSPVGIIEMLLPALESGAVLVLGEVRSAALDRLLTTLPQLSRLFEVVRLEPPSEAEAVEMLREWAQAAGASIPEDLLREASALARQYLGTHPSPSGELRLLRAAVERAGRGGGGHGKPAATMDDLVEGLAQLTGLPLDLLDERCPFDLAAVRARFTSQVMGQDEAVDCLVERLALFKAGISDPRRPLGVFLFVGGSGTGKTELARTLAAYLFGSPERLMRLDMSELQDASALERLMGDTSLAARGNSLAERVRRQPFSVLLLDEFERAHPRIWDVFLQVFDAGRLTDHRGDVADFRHTIIVLTSNLGAATGETRIGLTDSDPTGGPATVRRAVERTFRPEFLNRLDRVVVFRPLSRDVMRRILRKEMAEAFARRGLRRRDWAVEMEESAIELLVEQGFSPTLGARPLRRALERLLLTPLAEAIVDRRAPEGDQFLFVRADGDALRVEFVDPDAIGGAVTPGALAVAADRDLSSIVFEASGSEAEVAVLRSALATLQQRVGAAEWTGAKEALLLDAAAPAFWERADRFEHLGRIEYLDRIENALRAAASLLERLGGDPRAPRRAIPRDMVRRVAQQLYLLDAAAGEALDSGPQDAFVAVEPSHDDAGRADEARAFASRLLAMYETWARARGMRVSELELDGETGGLRVLAVAGFAAYRLLSPEVGLHVLERDEPGRAARRAAVRVRVEPQPASPARDGAAGLRRQAAQALGTRDPQVPTLVRRYREQPSPLVRDLVRGWRTGRIERVLGGDFDVIPVKE